MIKTEFRTLIEVTPNISNGIFNALSTFDIPWKTKYNALNLDLVYYNTISGSKIIAPLLDRMIDKHVVKMLSDTDMSELASMIFTINQLSWQKQYDTMFLQYNPIENYAMTEQMTDNRTVHEYGREINDTYTPNLTSTNTPNTVITTTQQVSAFNGGFTDTDKSISTPTGNTTIKQTGNSTTQSKNSGTDTDINNYHLTRSGNVGVTTSQQMLQSERDLWLWDYFREIVFPSVDKILVCPMYGYKEERW